MAHPPPSRPVVQGHRGFRAAWPENTLPGFAAALRAGVDAIELDVGLTSDGVVVVCHEPALNPDLTRRPDGAWIESPGPVIFRHSLADLRAFDVGRARPGGGVAVAFPRQNPVDGARLPTLAEVFALAADFTAWVDVELKTNPIAPDLTAHPEILVDAVVAVAEASGGRSRLALRSFDWRGLDQAARKWPDLPLTWLTEADTDRRPEWHGGRSGAAPEILADIAAGTSATWAPDHRDLSHAQVERARALGLRVVPWTVNAPEDVARLIGWGVDGVCSDDPIIARRVIDGLA